MNCSQLAGARESERRHWLRKLGLRAVGGAARPRAEWKEADMAETSRAVAAQSRPWWRRAWDGAKSTVRHGIGQQIAGALLIIFVDFFVGVPCAIVIILSGGGTPPALAAEAIETFVVLPANAFGVYLITSAGK